MATWLSWLLVGLPLLAQPIYEDYTFLTWVGPSDSPGAIDGPGASARFRRPWGIAVDGAGNAYVTDSWNVTVRKITPAGFVTTLAGLTRTTGFADGVGSAARFQEPTGIAVDTAGNVYVSDYDAHTIRKITPEGFVTTLAGLPGVYGAVDGRGSQARLAWPWGLALGPDGNLYVASNPIRRVTPEGEVSTVAGQFGQTGVVDGVGSAARFNQPISVTADGAGNLYVGDAMTDRLRKITPAGKVTTLTNTIGEVRFPSGLAVDGAGNLYVADCWNVRIAKITPGGPVTTLIGGWISAGGGLQEPAGVALGPGGEIYVADTGNHTIRRIDAQQRMSRVAGAPIASLSLDGPPGEAFLRQPRGLALDGAGGLFLTEASSAIRRITPDGTVSTVAGLPDTSGSADGVGSEARFSSPDGLALDQAGNLYVADPNCTIRKVTPEAVVTTLAGLVWEEGAADGLGSEARFYWPHGVAVDAWGKAYVADTSNDTIRKIGPDGRVTTIAGLAGQYGSTDGVGTEARFSCPEDLTVDSAGNVYVADTCNDVVRKITPEGVVTTLAGRAGWPGSTDGPGNQARFSYLSGITVDGAGDVFVSVMFSCTIRKITPKGFVTTLAGTPGWAGGNVDGTGSDVRFDYPGDIAVDGAGRLYVADSLNNSIRIGVRACLDRAVVDPPLAPVGVTRQLDTAPQTADGWQWTWIRRPANSQAELSSSTIRNPTFTPDVPDLYIFRLQATNSVTGHVALRTVEIQATPDGAAILTSPQMQPGGVFQFTLIAQTNRSCTLQFSSDLSTWTDWMNLTPLTSATLLVDPSAVLTSPRFYRARTP